MAFDEHHQIVRFYPAYTLAQAKRSRQMVFDERRVKQNMSGPHNTAITRGSPSENKVYYIEVLIFSDFIHKLEQVISKNK